MIKRIRIIPTLLIMLAMCIILFGGWSLYEHYFMKRPVEHALKKHTGITKYNLNWQADKLQVEIKSKKGKNIRELIGNLIVALEKHANGRVVQIEYINDESTPEIDALWSRMLFGISEAMVHQKYSVIPTYSKQLQQQNLGIQVYTEMDSRYVYIQLANKNGSRTVLLPLQVPSVRGII